MPSASRPSRPARPPGLRRRRFVAGLLVLAVAAGLTSCDAAQLNQLLTNYADNATAFRLNSGDNGASIDLGGGRYMVLMNDAYPGPLTNGARNPSTPFIHGPTAVIVDSDGTTDTLLGGSRGLLLQEMLSWDLLGNSVVTLSLSHLKQSTPVVSQVGPIVQIPGSNRSAWGEGIVRWGSHWYLYGAPRTGGEPLTTLLARVAVGGLRDPNQWKYWNGTTWSSYQANAAPLVDDAGADLTYLIRPAVHDGRIVALAQKQASQTLRYLWATSASPIDPVTITGVAYTPPERSEPCGNGGETYLYSLHPHSTTPPEESVWSFSRNCSVSTNVARFYRPVFFNLNLNNAPCPVLTDDEADSFLDATFEDLPARLPSNGDIAYWKPKLTVDGLCRARYLETLADDAGYLRRVVTGIYQQILGYAPDEPGRDYWVEQLASGARTTTYLARSLIRSPGFWTAAGATNAGFVDRVYVRVLGYHPDPDSLNYWVGRLQNGEDRDVVGLAIYQSTESRNRRIQAISQLLLGRDLTTGELTPWRTLLGSNGGDDVVVWRGLASLDEYLDKALVEHPRA